MLEKIISCGCLAGSGLKFIFHWNAHSPVFFASVCRSIFDFREKAELFNSFFANQCSLITNTNKLPTSCGSLTDKSLSNIPFTDNDIGKIIKGLDATKAYGHDMMSIRMLKICRDSIY